jgi:hypothetical protein
MTHPIWPTTIPTIWPLTGYLAHVAFEAEVVLEVPPHLLELRPRHKGDQVEVSAGLLDDHLFWRLDLQTLNCTWFHLCPPYHSTTVGGYLNQ